MVNGERGCAVSSKSGGRGPGGGRRAPVGERRRARTARALGISSEEKGHLDAMNDRSLARFGVGVGVLVQQEEGLRREAASHGAERERLPWHARLWWPFGAFHRLRRMQREAAGRSEEWSRRLGIVAHDVAARPGQPVDPSAARGADER